MLQFPWMMLCASTAFLQPHWPVAVVRYAYHQIRRLVSIFTSSKVYTIPPPPEDDAWGEGWRLPPPRKGISKGELLVLFVCVLFFTQQARWALVRSSSRLLAARSLLTAACSAAWYAADCHAMPQAGVQRSHSLEPGSRILWVAHDDGTYGHAGARISACVRQGLTELRLVRQTHFDHAKSELELCDPTTNATLSVLPLPKLMKASCTCLARSHTRRRSRRTLSPPSVCPENSCFQLHGVGTLGRYLTTFSASVCEHRDQ